MQALLKERFQLAFHREVAQRPVYALVLARSDGKLGRNMRPAAFECGEAFRERAAAAVRAGQPSPYPPDTETRIACGLGASPGRVLQGGATLSEFRAVLQRAVGRPVLDRTGLMGTWDLLLTYTPVAQTAAADLPVADSPDLFTALQEQLGLKLESSTGPIEMFVIDRIEPPTAN